MRKWTILAGVAALVFLFSPALAQKSKAPPKPRTEASLECSKQADAKGLHGKERRKFRRKCMKGYKKAA